MRLRVADEACQLRDDVVGTIRFHDADLDLAKGGVGRRADRFRHRNPLPACGALPAIGAQRGPRCRDLAGCEPFCATQSASVRDFNAVALSADCASARIPAASATATIASATRISISVNPRIASRSRCLRIHGHRHAVQRICGQRRYANSWRSTRNANGSLCPEARSGRMASSATPDDPHTKVQLSPCRRAMYAPRARRRRRSASSDWRRAAGARTPKRCPWPKRPASRRRHCARALACSSAPANRFASRAAAPRSSPSYASAATPAAIAMIAMTTSISISVKPRARACARRDRDSSR